ncbi:MAG: surface-adhesin E family protein [Burkholderiaceae bacterium]|nr:MAG: hypothetical protein CBC60_07085 [Betaproteobacteria bacterium TMED100]
MYKSILIGLLIFLLPSLGFSEWKNIAENNEAKIYVDLGSIRKVDDGIKSIWSLKNFNIPNEKIKSRQFKIELDCQQEEYRKLIRFSFTGFFSSGLPIKDYFKAEDWHPISDDELFKAVFTSVCFKKK